MKTRRALGTVAGAASRKGVRLAAAASVGAAVALVAGAVQSAPASAADIRPSYFLYSVGTGQTGPCADRVGTYLGDTSIGNTSYQTVYVDHYWVGDTSIYVYREQGFNTAAVYNGCYGSYPAYGYYGKNKISREVDEKYNCPSRSMSCTYRGTSYGSWVGGW